MVSRSVIFWEVDTQVDFMLPGGKLYVPGAEKLIPNMRRLTDAARQGLVFLVGHGCVHTPDDPEFARLSAALRAWHSRLGNYSGNLGGSGADHSQSDGRTRSGKSVSLPTSDRGKTDARCLRQS